MHDRTDRPASPRREDDDPCILCRSGYRRLRRRRDQSTQDRGLDRITGGKAGWDHDRGSGPERPQQIGTGFYADGRGSNGRPVRKG